LSWEDLSSDRQNQLYFNVGALAVVLNLGKEYSCDIIEYLNGKYLAGDMWNYFTSLAVTNSIYLNPKYIKEI
jgi:hypothetical protein